MRAIVLSVVLTVCIPGCALMDPEFYTLNTASEELPSNEQEVEAPSDQISRSTAFQSTYRQQLLGIDSKTHSNESNRNINFYVRGMMQDLVGNLRFVNAQTPVAVTNFVFLDSDFERAGLIGMQLSESFIHEVHKFGIPVIDFKTTDYVRVSRAGDFVLSKDFLELNGDVPIKYVLAGTLVKSVTGYNVNARIIGINSKAVVASAQGFIPESIINQLMSSHFNDGIPVISNDSMY